MERKHERSASHGENQASSVDLAGRVLDWLQRHGYPTEFRAGVAFQNAGWVVAHSDYYEDPETSKTREIDIKASLTQVSSANSPWAGFEFVAECKLSRGKPWVVFARPTPAEAFISLSDVVLGSIAEIALMGLDTNMDGVASFLRPAGWTGHGVARAFSDGNDADSSQPYAALRGAVAAAAAAVQSMVAHRESSPKMPKSVTFHVPMVIVDAPLFRYTLDADGAEHVTAIEWIQVAAPSSSHGSVRAILTTLDGLPRYLAEVTPHVRALLKETVDKIDVLFDMHGMLSPTQSE